MLHHDAEPPGSTAQADANTRNNPIEDIESHLPLRINRYELREDACAAGEWRGGLGAIREFTYLDDGGASVEGEGHKFEPWGFSGGQAGFPAELIVRRAGGDETRLPSKVPYTRARAGDRFVVIGPSGGGYGDALRRDPERVLGDVLDGYISVETAARDYRVVITASLTIDQEATARARAAAQRHRP